MKVVYEVRDNAGGYDEYPDETLVAIHASLPEAEEHAESSCISATRGRKRAPTSRSHEPQTLIWVADRRHATFLPHIQVHKGPEKGRSVAPGLVGVF